MSRRQLIGHRIKKTRASTTSVSKDNIEGTLQSNDSPLSLLSLDNDMMSTPINALHTDQSNVPPNDPQNTPNNPQNISTDPQNTPIDPQNIPTDPHTNSSNNPPNIPTPKHPIMRSVKLARKMFMAKKKSRQTELSNNNSDNIDYNENSDSIDYNKIDDNIFIKTNSSTQIYSPTQNNSSIQSDDVSSELTRDIFICDKDIIVQELKEQIVFDGKSKTVLLFNDVRSKLVKSLNF
uniref:Uncharacterized protein n=1 Tax=Megaviridae environmental sample TaxID=1737588 RepID=A0A5J6VK08_9VIRU|nr:MAG: hypothetical protein [Megaviridae environmental sample]